MLNHLVIRGVPYSLEQHGWWLSDHTHAAPPPRRPADRMMGVRRWHGYGVVALILLVVIGDLLFWRHSVGISLVLFVGAVFAAATYALRHTRRLLGPALLLIAGALPAVEFVQPLSIAFLFAALIGALVWAWRSDGREAGWLSDSAGFAVRLPGKWLSRLAWPFMALMRGNEPAAGRPRMGGLPSHLLRTWTLPVGGAFIFASLLIEANPVIGKILTFEIDLAAMLKRILFWAGTALFCAPFLWPGEVRPLAVPKAEKCQGIYL